MQDFVHQQYDVIPKGDIHSLKLIASVFLKIGPLPQKEMNHLPTILFQGLFIFIYIYIQNPNDPYFGWKRPCFGWLTFKHRGHLGSRYMLLSDGGSSSGFHFEPPNRPPFQHPSNRPPDRPSPSKKHRNLEKMDGVAPPKKIHSRIN